MQQQSQEITPIKAAMWPSWIVVGFVLMLAVVGVVPSAWAEKGGATGSEQAVATAAKRAATEKSGKTIDAKSGISSDKKTTGKKKRKRPPPLVTLATVHLSHDGPVTTALGTVITRQQAQVASRVAGWVETVHVEAGNRVRAGDLLVTLDGSEVAHTLAMRRATVREAEAKLLLAKTQRERDTTLKKRSVVTASRVKVTEAEEAIQQAMLDQARAQLALTTDLSKRYRITAPFAGVVTARSVEAGEWLRQGDPVVTLVNTGRVELKVPLPESIAGTLKAGQRARATRRGAGEGGAVAVRLRAAPATIDPVTRNRLTYWRFETLSLPTGRPRPGHDMRLILPSKSKKARLLVHKDALLGPENRRRVFVLKRANTVQPVTVRTGIAVGSHYVVHEGLSEGDRVVVLGNERLRPGQTVRLANGDKRIKGGDRGDKNGGDSGNAAEKSGDAAQGGQR
ncbi:MAG: efflux RND transporter periplasmic adaptor subunit [Magnetococcales bacterium]|nr:efflux RND transporter periplasmic adaptor subunit [Magnetococcales bacterium]